jgi:hypothetical protein
VSAIRRARTRKPQPAQRPQGVSRTVLHRFEPWRRRKIALRFSGTRELHCSSRDGVNFRRKFTAHQTESDDGVLGSFLPVLCRHHCHRPPQPIALLGFAVLTAVLLIPRTRAAGAPSRCSGRTPARAYRGIPSPQRTALRISSASKRTGSVAGASSAAP